MVGEIVARVAYLLFADLFLWIAAAFTGFSVVVALITALLEVIPKERRW